MRCKTSPSPTTGMGAVGVRDGKRFALPTAPCRHLPPSLPVGCGERLGGWGMLTLNHNTPRACHALQTTLKKKNFTFPTWQSVTRIR
ncbi:hypothetical protein CEXT_60111 [Caerostris extrusa]|uniref:Uncharacterized protein n=1 Tax=Caerostris extrusa TaxID=172846 RepID=A0AAV4YBB9_CAEEX|nr:hypothetical protein CEXT_60111 [Caerostris extrusa]